MSLPPIDRAELDEILVATEALWAEMRGQRIFLTGGTGFFGCWLIESFLHANRALGLGAHLTVLTRSPETFGRKCPHITGVPALSLLRGDVRTFEFLHGEYPFVIHAATEASARQAAEEPLEMLSTIVDGTRRVLDFAATHGTRKLLLTSSGAVYGPQPRELLHLPEDYAAGPNPLDPASVYGEGKRVAEHLCALHAQTTSIEYKIARAFAFLGPHLPLDSHFAAGNFLADALAGRDIEIASDGTGVRSYLYASDLAIWLWTMLFRAPSLRAYNVGSELDVDIRALGEAVAANVNPSGSVRVAKTPDSSMLPPRYVPSTARAQKELGLRQMVSLEEALRRTAAWHRLK
jgi:nucleoside-diphosphate-sugar epimerase